MQTSNIVSKRLIEENSSKRETKALVDTIEIFNRYSVRNNFVDTFVSSKYYTKEIVNKYM